MASTLTYYPSLPQSLLPLLLWSWLLLLHSENVASFSSGRRFYHGRTCCSSSSSVTHKIILSTLQSPRGGEPLHHPISSTTNTVMMHAKSKATEEEVVVTLIHSHHLLDHKPDNMILTGKKFKLRGIACLGRPGVALCIGSPSNVKKFTNKLRGAMPQKKFGVVDIIKKVAENTNAVSILDEVVDGFEAASLGELRELLTAVGREDQFLALVGIDNNSANGNSNSDKGNSNGSLGSKSASGTNKRKKRG